MNCDSLLSSYTHELKYNGGREREEGGSTMQQKKEK